MRFVKGQLGEVEVRVVDIWGREAIEAKSLPSLDYPLSFDLNIQGQGIHFHCSENPRLCSN